MTDGNPGRTCDIVLAVSGSNSGSGNAGIAGDPAIKKITVQDEFTGAAASSTR
jgi:hypothetical protein